MNRRNDTVILICLLIKLYEDYSMLYRNLVHRLHKLHQRLNGSEIETDLTSYQATLSKIHDYHSTIKNRSDEALKQIASDIHEKLRGIESPNEYLIPVFGLIHEIVQRELGMTPFDEQVIGGMVMHEGKLAEMQTGEGKTLAAVFPVALHGMTGKGVHVLTFNDYLAKRDAHWMGPVYEFLGLTVAFVQEGMSKKDRRKAYLSDIVYVTAKEAGFDFLRDSLCQDLSQQVHRPFHMALVDEADSILIDEARVPLVIAETAEEQVSEAQRMAAVARALNSDDVDFEENGRAIHLTDRGLIQAEAILGCDNLYSENHMGLLARLHCALHAEHLLQRDVDYIVRNDKVELVDEFTGRIADLRRWPDGLQAALEAKEGLKLQSKGRILNSITLQHFLQLYPRLCGMTATAQSAEDEFRSFYDLSVVVIPPHKPCIRIDDDDRIFSSKKQKTDAVIEEIIRIHKTGRPILVGTCSVGESDCLARILMDEGVPCQVLNAKNNETEAEIIAQAGRPGAVTISTNMAGRGTDIRLGGRQGQEKARVSELGGLYVIGTNRYESGRIDRQLRGRAGRQGDPGSSRFFISMEDDLFVRFGLKDWFMSQMKIGKDEVELSSPSVVQEINHIQRVIEGQNLDIKTTLFNYSSLLENQRKIVDEKRQHFLQSDSALELFRDLLPNRYERLLSNVKHQDLSSACRLVALYHLDRVWSDHLADMADLREGIHLSRLGGQDPLHEFHLRAIDGFSEMEQRFKERCLESFDRIQVRGDTVDLTGTGVKAPSATWTYLVNDNPFDDLLGVKIMSSLGLSLGAVMWTPLMILYQKWMNKRRKAFMNPPVNEKGDSPVVMQGEVLEEGPHLPI